MSVTIRLSKTGKKNAHSFKIVVSTTKDKRDGKALDVLGHFNPSHTPTLFKIDKKKYEEWVGKGALVTDAVKKLIDGTYEFKPYHPNKKQEDGIIEEGATEEESAPEEN
jgi:small subunit ribosomal protein S16